MIALPTFRGMISRNYLLAPHTTWRVGGPAEIYAIPVDIQDLIVLIAAAQAQNAPVHVLGRGSNLLISDAGVPGITVSLHTAFRYIEWEKGLLRVGAGVPMPTLAQRAAKLGFAGFEHLIGIPGTVGAGIVINAGKGTHRPADMREIVKSVKYINDENALVNESAERLDFGYRTSRLKGTKAVVVEATFQLEHPGDPTAIEQRTKAILAERRAKFPLQLPNAGSVFKRPVNQPPAGQLIESLGLKGFRIGDAQISMKHANFIVNLGNATADQIRQLIEYSHDRVFAAYGIDLEREIIFWPPEFGS